MISWKKFLVLTLLFLGPVHSAMAGPGHTLRELFYMLPEEVMAGNPKHVKIYFDTKNGFVAVHSDGMRDCVQAALFRYPDGKPLLAVSYHMIEGKSEDFETGHFPFEKLAFFTESADGRSLVPVDRSIFPFAEGKGLFFHLPRMGRTILVKNDQGTLVSQIIWNGQKFEVKK